MAIKITGKNIDLGESLRTYTLEKIQNAVEKYAGQSMSGHVSLEKHHDGFVAHCGVHLSSGLDMQASGRGGDPYACVDAAVERLEKQVRRYRRRLKSHGQANAVSAQAALVSGIDYTLDPDVAVAPEDEQLSPAGAPAVIAEMPARVRAMSVSDAVMQMDLADSAFLVFRNAAHGGVNVVYRRSDGNIGWIDPAGSTAAS